MYCDTGVGNVQCTSFFLVYSHFSPSWGLLSRVRGCGANTRERSFNLRHRFFCLIDAGLYYRLLFLFSYRWSFLAVFTLSLVAASAVSFSAYLIGQGGTRACYRWVLRAREYIPDRLRVPTRRRFLKGTGELGGGGLTLV